ncbi:hypothetical protein JYU29_05580 [Tianweitania sp. BSSL-BM11]|uniref:DUF1515 domain-containing protein n=1 Tax=Tianweitania aestuarii TaxID=2814886 RepID=A0ABS5RSW9_9HYPH|nr:hypothetical protein [Tianweitania aestuarii]MBS9720156.1 hypothetical protein [Tianweitania aestuarii]
MVEEHEKILRRLDGIERNQTDQAKSITGLVQRVSDIEARLDELDSDSLRRIVKLEPEVTADHERKRAWRIVTETLKKIALWLSAMAGGLYVASEIVKGLAK